ncbi:MAG: phosphate/phosphite/phosphonate ABC transporter substrate-binding protein [Candidatus Dormibacteria bacterium]
MPQPILVGAVAYTANVVPIWESIREYFRGSDAEMDFVLYSNYERQVDSLLAGHIDIAWNTNLAWVRTSARTEGGCRALAMRDVDAAFRTVLVSRAGSGFTGLESLRGKRLALGSQDSAHAAILPLYFLAHAGLEDEVDIIRFNTDVGKHGDTGRSELDAIRAVLDEDAEAAALGITTWESIGRDQLMPGALEEFWTSPHYSHCNFTALPSFDEQRGQRWVRHLMAMSWEVPEQRRIMELEGLREWVPPRLEGYRSLFEAVEEQKLSMRW